jgi:hypothetical protein
MRGLCEFAITLMLVLSEKALINTFLRQVIRLSSHGRFVTHDTHTIDDDTINWDVHTILNHDNITNQQVVSVHLLLFGVSDDFNLISKKSKFKYLVFI